MSKTTRKIYYVIRNCDNVIQSLKVQGFESILFTALLYRNGKKRNSIEKANTEYFGELMHNYDKSEEPDKVKVEFRKSKDHSLLWSKEFPLANTSVEPTSVQQQIGFQGLGEAQINAIVGRKISDYEKIKENEALHDRLEQLEAENEELKGELEEATAQLDAKKQIEYYANLLGMAMPGLAKVLGKSQAGSALGFLSGTEDEQEESEPAPAQDKIPDPTSDNHAIIQMVNEYMHSLDKAQLEVFYVAVCEFSRNQKTDRVEI